MNEPTRLWCEKSGAAPGADNSTHHLIPRIGTIMSCRYCGQTDQQIRETGDW